MHHAFSVKVTGGRGIFKEDYRARGGSRIFEKAGLSTRSIYITRQAKKGPPPDPPMTAEATETTMSSG